MKRIFFMAVLLIMVSATAKDIDYELEVRGNSTIYVFSDEYSGAMILEGCTEGDGCSFEVEVPDEETPEVEIDYSQLTAAIANTLDVAIANHQAWETGTLAPTITEGACSGANGDIEQVDKRIADFQAWITGTLMPSVAEVTQAKEDQRTAEAERDVLQARLDSQVNLHNKTSSLYERNLDNADTLIRALGGIVTVLLLIVLYEADVLTAIFEKGKGLLSRI